MTDLNFYIEAAKKRSGVKSERQLCKMLGGSPNILNHYRKGALPSDETMIRLAEIGGQDVLTAMLNLNIWRTEGKAQTAYKRLYNGLRKTMHTLSVAGLIMILSLTQGEAAVPYKENNRPGYKQEINETHDIYYHTKYAL